jgi:hypothetical protein
MPPHANPLAPRASGALRPPGGHHLRFVNQCARKMGHAARALEETTPASGASVRVEISAKLSVPYILPPVFLLVGRWS